LTADGEEWRIQRRSLVPLFTPRQVTAFANAMSEATCEGVERLRQNDGRRIDLSDEMARLTLEILEHTLFSSGLSHDPGEFQRAVTRYFDTIGRVDLMDLLSLPQFLPRFGRRRGRATLEWFGKAVKDIVGTRRKLIAEGRAAPRDILTLLLEAQDPETGRGMPEDDLRANIVTFIGAGHETTANALTWTLYLLLQSPGWRDRVEEETDAQLLTGPMDTLAERMPLTKAVLEEALRALSAGGHADQSCDRCGRNRRKTHLHRYDRDSFPISSSSPPHSVGAPRQLRSQPIPRRQS
jgi:cytochrome P450